MKELAQVVSNFGLEALLAHIHTVIVFLRSDGMVISGNPALDAMPAAWPASKKFDDHIPTEERTEFRHRLKLACESVCSSRWVMNLVTDETGAEVPYDSLLLPAGDGRALLFAERIAVDPHISCVIDKLQRQVKLFRIESEHAKKIALKKHAEIEAVIAQADEVSNVDTLTLLPNRRQIIRKLQNEVLRLQRYNIPLSISMLDVDHFKRVNDTYGHLVGDQVLRAIGHLLREDVRHPDLVARFGGEEFLIVLPNSSQEAAIAQAIRLCKKVYETAIEVQEHTIHVTLSIGVAQFQYGIDSWQTLLSRADTAMYDAKHAGRNGWAASKPLPQKNT